MVRPRPLRPAGGAHHCFYRALSYLRTKLESVGFNAAWLSIDTRKFSAVILSHVHSLWTTLLQWEEHCTRMPLFYLDQLKVLKVEAASPFVEKN